MVKYYCDRCEKDITNEHYNALILGEVPEAPNRGVNIDVYHLYRGVDMDVYNVRCLCRYCMMEYNMLMNGFMQNKVQVYKNPMTKQFECEGKYL
jgi:hypothetical protein